MNSVSAMILGLFLGFYIGRLYPYLPAYCDDYWLIERAVNEDPAAWYAWFVRAHKRWQQQAVREALNCWVMASMLSPKEYKILYNIAVVMKYLHNDGEAEKYIKLANDNVIKGQEQTAAHMYKEFKEGRYQLIR